ncbi:penicillin-binding protein 1C [Paracandidimonas soli]|uniref:penicillin-binding protein 1C n=1 Tax=Paracandidimonas soli TaxID=1917182 RepID=UPI00333F2A47
MAVVRNVACAALLCAAMAVVQAAGLPSFDETRQAYQASDTMLLDRSGQPLQRVRVDFNQRRGDWIAYEQMSPALLSAVLQSEDKRFWSHAGVDWKAVAGAAWDRVAHGARRGASTITMQVAGLVDPDLRRGEGGRSLAEKWSQAMTAWDLEEAWSKPQILEAYLNLAAFRGELVGIDALSRTLFRKHPSGLDWREAALAAVLLRGPNVSAQRLESRACALLRELGQEDACQSLGAFIAIVLQRGGAWDGVDRQAPHLARLLLSSLKRDEPLPETWQTSIDGDLQRFVAESMNRHLHMLRDVDVRDAAVVVMDNETGEILAYVGSSGAEWSAAAQVDHATAKRQAGSALKPFLYAQAIDQQRITAASLLLDSPLNLQTGSGIYLPGNYDGGFSGWVSARTALASSLNIPAVRVLTMVTPESFAAQLNRFGLGLDRDGGFYGYSLALGSADVSLLALTNAYRGLANGGVHAGWTLDAGGKTEGNGRVMSAQAAWIVADILSDRHARSRTFGMDSPLSTPFWTAVKTGTSKDMRDNWCMGWSDRYTVGVWVGNSEGASMRDVSGVTGAGPIWNDIMRYLHRSHPSEQPDPPAGVVRQPLVFKGVQEPARVEAFLADTAVSEVSLSTQELDEGPLLPSILYPVDGTILALDPDIPMAHQRVRFVLDGVPDNVDADGFKWLVEGVVAGKGNGVLWQPEPGRHRIRLLDPSGLERDSVTIHVRAPARTLPSLM